MKMFVTKRVAPFLLGLGLLVSAAPASASSARVSAAAVEASGTVHGAVAQATFKIAVTNDESSPITNVVAVFADDSTVAIGDVAAGKTSVSGAVNRTMNLDDEPSRNVVFKVTLRFHLNGEPVEVQTSLTLKQ